MRYHEFHARRALVVANRLYKQKWENLFQICPPGLERHFSGEALRPFEGDINVFVGDLCLRRRITPSSELGKLLKDMDDGEWAYALNEPLIWWLVKQTRPGGLIADLHALGASNNVDGGFIVRPCQDFWVVAVRGDYFVAGRSNEDT